MGRGTLSICIAAALGVLLGGCASVVSGTAQEVAVTPVCEGIIAKASCTLSNDKGRWELRAPGSLSVQKSLGDLRVECTNADARGVATFVSKPNGGVWGNLIAGGLIGYAVDSANGAGYNYPERMPVVMAGPCPGS